MNPKEKADRASDASRPSGNGVDHDDSPDLNTTLSKERTHSGRVVTSIYRAIVLELERHRIAANWTSSQLDDAAGVQDGYFQKILHADSPSGRQAQWATIQLFVDALLPDGFDAEIRRQPGGCMGASKLDSKIKALRAQYHQPTQRDRMRELAKLRSAGMSAARRSDIARQAAMARWQHGE
jgi:hypothetical protein